MMASASSFVTPFFKSVGAFSTKSLASFNPKSVNDLTSLITLIFAAASNPSSLTSNTVFSAFSSPFAAPEPPLAAATLRSPNPIPGIITTIVGISFTPNLSRRTSDKSDTSSSVSPEISSAIAKTRSGGGCFCSGEAVLYLRKS
ncbi:hypothetical protein PanWU01x14_073010 [Parasponia andersonii]|uniref:Uncharacterized protein n=1 Tax=Parasponia andersonii TaxID=3476 RepID=A0A2P5DDY1_PARAD|nr:hypothetical protein PanWU01x14_073010 [Parasponia andersonii]